MKKHAKLVFISILTIALGIGSIYVTYMATSSDTSPTDSSAGTSGEYQVCNTTNDCQTGLTCVESYATSSEKRCSSLSLNNNCDKNLLQCNPGLTCVNHLVSGGWYKCTDGTNGSPCSSQSDCQSGLTCVTTNGFIKGCSDLNSGSNCDKNLLQCNADLTCLNSAIGFNLYICSNGAINSPCSSQTDCESGLSCVSATGVTKLCSNLELNSKCDYILQQCKPNLICTNTSQTSTNYNCLSSDAQPEPSPVCGNGTVEAGEQCDDGNTSNNDTCSSTCTIITPQSGPVCGNGTVETGEQCDDGNTSNNDTCSSTCTIITPQSGPVCGNGTVEAGEQCDDGNTSNNDTCSSTCTIITPQSGPVCGNGTVETGEQCDDGNTNNSDNCSNFCILNSLPNTALLDKNYKFFLYGTFLILLGLLAYTGRIGSSSINKIIVSSSRALEDPNKNFDERIMRSLHKRQKRKPK